ncbi:MAG: NUDIX hydrolase [Patescibacteria group bacterium]
MEVLVEKDGKVFLVHRVDEHWNGWHIPGGYIPCNAQSIDDAYNRVVKRELGYKVHLKKILEVYKWKPGEHRYGFPTSIVCVCEPLGEIKETETARFFEHVPDGFLADCHRQFVDKYFQEK